MERIEAFVLMAADTVRESAGAVALPKGYGRAV